jgi:hypothetical protein
VSVKQTVPSHGVRRRINTPVRGNIYEWYCKIF